MVSWVCSLDGISSSSILNNVCPSFVFIFFTWLKGLLIQTTDLPSLATFSCEDTRKISKWDKTLESDRCSGEK